ncbi:hypothetical protein CALVIDRAFT_416087 [Calocera viscosa TUFC12733]|uniref:Uncharacterized protein n=1 Tax=Calocera viscosa (strain TUFC12733) TaxID=1330018 RepID=A0A167G0K9_CALVF|nr:hypothetical protein CALVIDRAFT_416087 [Calocera viscosa TUFC12733]
MLATRMLHAASIRPLGSDDRSQLDAIYVSPNWAPAICSIGGPLEDHGTTHSPAASLTPPGPCPYAQLSCRTLPGRSRSTLLSCTPSLHLSKDSLGTSDTRSPLPWSRHYQCPTPGPSYPALYGWMDARWGEISSRPVAVNYARWTGLGRMRVRLEVLR